jgi:hypothetical protein
MKHTTDDVPPTGGHILPDKYVRKDVTGLENVTVVSDLDRHIVRLLALHPELRVKFRNQDLASLDNATKQSLLEDMNKVLGIKSPRKKPNDLAGRGPTSCE